MHRHARGGNRWRGGFRRRVPYSKVTKKAPIKRITPVILCGGEGARLAPLSSPERPKYLLKGWSARSILQETILRVSNDALFNEPLLITSNRTEALVRADAAKVAGARFTLMAEPVARSTCPPLITAALLASRNKANPLLLALPADHYIESLEIFIEILKVAALETVVG
ncbi:MAG: hypothetical protein C0609_09490 [Deltaproteobacteria bacterium]|nr:MAG: hypothetical protein C0609_09490 [Deltaproteobacteria bacterium]